MRTSTFWQMSRMAWQYLMGRKLRTALTTLAVVFGVALIFAINLIMPSILEMFNSSLDATSAADVNIISATGAGFDPATTLATVGNVEGVDSATGILRRHILLPDTVQIGEEDQITINGVDVATAQAVSHYQITAGRFLATDDNGVALISDGVLAVDDTFSLITASGVREFTVIGTFSGEDTNPVLLVTLPDAQAIFGQPDLINLIEVRYAEGQNAVRVNERLENALGDGFLVGVEQSNEMAIVRVSYTIFNLLGVLALFMGAFLIFNTFRTVIIERRHDLAMLRAIGATRRQITQTLLIESLVQGVLGVIIGLVLGYLMAVGLTTAMSTLRDEFRLVEEIEIRLSISAIAIATGMGLITTLLAGFIPARNAGKVSPLEGLRPVSTGEVKRAARWGLLVGMSIVALAVLLVGSEQTAPLGAIIFMVGTIFATPGLVIPMARLLNPLLTLWFKREGDLARGNLIRQPGRAAITASTLMIGLATLILVVAVLSGFKLMVGDMLDSNFSSDVLIVPPTIGTYGNVLGADESLATSLRELPEVAALGTLRSANGEYKGQRLEILGINGEDYAATAPLVFVEGNVETAYIQLTKGRNAIVSAIAGTVLGVKVGDEFSLTTAQGEQTYQVVGIANDLLHFKVNAVYISHANLAQDFHKTEDVMLMINLRDGIEVDAALAKIEPLLAAYPQFRLEETAAYRQNMETTMTQGFSFYYVLISLILIPAGLGLLNTLTINVLERTREIGVIRATGGTRKQVRRMVMAEALLLGLFGASIGVLAGVAMSYGFTLAFGSIGWEVPYVFPVMGIIAALVLAILVAMVSSILPARNAAKLDIIRALQYE